MKRLFNTEWETYAPEADDIVKRSNDFLRPLLKEYSDKGYSLLDVEVILRDQVDALCAFARLTRNMEKRKWERKQNKEVVV